MKLFHVRRMRLQNLMMSHDKVHDKSLSLSLQELSQEKKRTLELLRERGQDVAEAGSDRRGSLDSQKPEVQLQGNLRQIEEQMKNLLKEKEQADER